MIKMISFNSYKAAQASSSNTMATAEKSPKKYNMLFSFNFDENEVDSDNSTDSENANLRIDVAEMDDIEQPKKRRRAEEYEISVLNEMEQELERQLDAKAAKTNLTATNVKNILKHVITNEHVLAMVQNRLHNAEDNVVFEPKLTRAKAKELAKTQPNIPWPMTPVKMLPPSEVQALIAEELSEDSSDEEYKPEEQDPPSEDEGDGNLISDIDSQPLTPAIVSESGSIIEQQSTNAANVSYDAEGVFKIPIVPHVPTEEESIGHRTRSKLSLNETSIEQIEQSFIPPDITIDMYDWDCDIDEEWDKFLKEFTKPLPHEPNVDDDPEADPEYNILEDRESELLDKEELRVDNGVKVTRKELNDLIAEYSYEYEDMYFKGQIEQPKKRKSADNMNSTISNPINNSMIDLIPALAEPELPKLVDSKLHSLLAIQFEQHVQLMAQHYVMTYMHPEFHSQSDVCKENLESIRILQRDEYSSFNVKNLDAAMNLISDWEAKFEDEKFHARFLDNLQQEIQLGKKMFKNRLKYQGELDPSMRKIFIESEALMYPELLPITTFRTEIINARRSPYSESEKRLLVLGLSEFIPFVEEQRSKFKGMRQTIERATTLINQYLMPNRSPEGLRAYINAYRRLKTDNPIKRFFETREISSRIHCIADNYDIKAPKDHPVSSLPPIWQKYIEREKNRKYDSLESLVSDLSNSTTDFFVDEDLLTHTVNMMPSMSLRETGKKSGRLSAITENLENKESSSDETSQQMRKTTPRLAKTRSVQNMKLKNQVSGSKNLLATEASKSNAKNESPSTSQEAAGSTKGDNEDEIAELMLASTTIKKDTVNRKKAKQVRESENIKRMLEAEKELGQEERATKFAASFIQKLHMTLESSNPELLRSVIKLYLEYSEKLEKNETESDNKVNDQNGKMSVVRETQDRLAINLYKDVYEVLKDHPEMCTDFLLFLKPHQAAMINKLVEHTMLQKMSDFINAAQVYFAKQPSRMARVMQAITQLAADPNVTLETVHATMDPVLKGHPFIMDMFQQIIPSGKPPESLFAASLFENLTCPVLPHDKHRTFSEDAPELYENIELPTPTTQDDPYGGDNCKCDCHETSDPQSKTVSEHCISCGVRFLNGRVYLQTSEGLRPAKVTFPGDDEEKFENIARVSLKTTEKPVLVPPTGRRRKSSKNDLNSEEVAQKQCPSKSSPVKDNDDGDRSTLKTKRGVKSPPKFMDQRRYSKSSEISSNSTSSMHSNNEVTSPLKSKREKRAERREAKTESKTIVDLNNKCSETAMISSEQEEGTFKKNRTEKTEEFNKPNDSGDSEVCIGAGVDDSNLKFNAETLIKSETVVNNKPWTRQEDALLLQNIQEDYSESTFVKVSETLGDRTVQQVKERCQILLSLLEKMV